MSRKKKILLQMEQNAAQDATVIVNDEVKVNSYFSDSLRRFRKNKLAMVCLGVIILLVLIAIFAKFLSPYDPNVIDPKNKHAFPNSTYPLGTDEYGRDILSRIIYGTRVSLLVGLVSTAITTILGVILGSIAGYYGGLIDTIISRTIEIFSAFPDILFALGIMYALGPGIMNLFIALGILGWTGTARLIRSQVLQIKEREFIEASRTAGAKSFWIIMKHLIPNCVSTIIIVVTMNIPGAILTEASMSFLGLGVQPPQSSWGSMIFYAKTFIRKYPFYSIFPGIAIVITVLAFNIFGDGLRDALDPRLRS